MKGLIVSFLFIINLGFSQTNYSLSFENIDDHVNCGNDTSLNVLDDFTIEAWFKLNEWDQMNPLDIAILLVSRLIFLLTGSLFI